MFVPSLLLNIQEVISTEWGIQITRRLDTGRVVMGAVNKAAGVSGDTVCRQTSPELLPKSIHASRLPKPHL